MPRIPHPRTPRTDPSRSQKIGKPHDPSTERQRSEQQGQKDLDPVGERDPRRDEPEEEI